MPLGEPEIPCAAGLSGRLRVRACPRHVRYVNGNPLNFDDPTGHYLCERQGDAICPGQTQAATQKQYQDIQSYDQSLPGVEASLATYANAQALQTVKADIANPDLRGCLNYYENFYGATAGECKQFSPAGQLITPAGNPIDGDFFILINGPDGTLLTCDHDSKACFASATSNVDGVSISTVQNVRGPVHDNGLTQLLSTAALVVASDGVAGEADTEAMQLGKSAHVLESEGVMQGGQWSRFNKLKGQDGYFDVVIHGAPDGFARDSGFTYPVSAEELAAEVLASPGYAGDPIRLIACQAACGSAAQDFANAMGVDVIAPNDDAWITQKGNVVVGPRPNTPTGDWVPFSPGGGNG